MPDPGNLPNWIAVALQVALIVIAALAVYLVLRKAVELAVRGFLERRTAEAGAEGIPPLELERRMRTVSGLALRIGGGILFVIAALMVLATFDVEIGPAVAGLGVVGIAVGLGAQTLIRDWLNGIFIVLENQFSEGDVVRIAGVDGVVESFSLRRTTLRDIDGTVHTVPNGQIAVASNMTRQWARVNLDIAIAADANVQRATTLIDGVGEELKEDPEWGRRLVEAPAVRRVEALGGGTITLKVLGQVRAAEQWAVAGELRKRILAALSAAKIEIR